MGANKKSSQGERRKVSLLATLLVMFTLLGKALLVPYVNFQGFSFRDSLLVAWNDLPVFGFILLLTFLNSLCPGRNPSLLLRLASALACLHYLIDTLVVLLLFNRVGFVELLQFTFSVLALPQGMLFAPAALLLIVLIVFSRIAIFPAPNLRWLGVPAVIFLCLPTLGLSEPLNQVASPISFRLERIIGKSATRFSESEIASLSLKSYPEETSWAQKPNIIILIVESLSAADSFRTSGLGNLLPKFDAWSERGVLFTNAFANHFSTEGGIISLFTGFPPVIYPGANWDLYRSFDHLPGVRSFVPKEYQKIFLATSNLGFRYERTFLLKVGFDEVRDLSNVESFQKAEKAVFDSPPDHVLYEEAVRQIPELKSPYLLAIETTSSHKPYQHPRGGSSTKEGIWEYVDGSLDSFLSALERQKFFDTGIVLILGDHRRMDAVSPPEREKYSGCAENRIALSIIGAGVPAQVVDSRVIQQSDILRVWSLLFSGGQDLSPYPILVGRYVKPLIGDAPLSVRIASRAEGEALECHEGTVFGASTSGFEKTPSEGVAAVQRVVASLQHLKEHQ